jgi:hypothetical protein
MYNLPVSARILMIFLLSGSLMATGQVIPAILDSDLPGLTINRNETFENASLWGYMNGGADIYLEYGFKVLRVEEFLRDNESIKLELFKMDSPVAAFGIYSIKTFKCKRGGVLTNIDCLNNYQFQLLYGDHYIQFSNESGTEKAQQFMIDLAYVLLVKLQPAVLALPVKYLTDSLNIPLSDIKMLKGELGIQARAHELTDYFSGIDTYQVYFARSTKEENIVKYYEIVFDRPEMKEKFLKNIEGKNFQVLREGEISILGVDTE